MGEKFEPKPVGNWIPGINAVKLGIESAIGQTSSRRKLSGKERIARGLEAGALLLVYTVIAEDMYGQGVSDATFQAAAWSKFVANAAHSYLNKEAVRNIFKRPAFAGLFFVA